LLIELEELTFECLWELSISFRPFQRNSIIIGFTPKMCLCEFVCLALVFVIIFVVRQGKVCLACTVCVSPGSAQSKFN